MTGEYEVIGWPYTTNMSKNAHVRGKRVDNAEVPMIRTYAAHERIAVSEEAREDAESSISVLREKARRMALTVAGSAYYASVEIEQREFATGGPRVSKEGRHPGI